MTALPKIDANRLKEKLADSNPYHQMENTFEERREEYRAMLQELGMAAETIEYAVEHYNEDYWTEEIGGHYYTCHMENGRVVRERSYTIDEFEEEMMDFAAELDQATYARLRNS